MARPAVGAPAGFTLLEVLVALTLLAFLATLVAQGLGTGARMWTAAERVTDRTADVGAVSNLLRRTIGEAYPAFVSANLADRTIDFDGQPETLTFVAPLPDALGSGLLAHQKLFVTGKGREGVLVLEWQVDLPTGADDQPPPTSKAKLLDRVDSVHFGYYGRDVPSQPPDWLGHWAGKVVLPELVSVHIVSGETGHNALPDLIVEPRRTMNVACIYDPADIACRRVR